MASVFERKKLRVRGKIKDETSIARQFFRAFVWLVCCGVVITGIWYGTRLEFFTINNVIVEGGETISHGDIQTKVNEELRGAYLLLIPKHFVYLYPHDRIIDVLEKIPSIHTISVTQSSHTTLHVSFEEYMPHALWCTDNIEVQVCYFIDETGYAFIPAPVLSSGTFVRHTSEGVSEIAVGQVMNQETLRAIDEFIARVSEEFKFRISKIVHKKNGDIEFYSNGGGMILASEKKDFRVTFENLKSVLDSPDFKHIAPGNFKYIDVRFDNKVFVNEELEPISTSTATTSLPLD